MIELFTEALSKTAILTCKELRAHVEQLSADISASPHKSRDRDSSQIARDVSAGVICEVGIAKLLGQRNQTPWNLNDRSSYSYDVIDDIHQKKHEVKHQHGDHWSFTPEVIKTLINNLAESPPDTIITASYVIDEDCAVVTPRLIIDPAHFRSYMRRSQYRPGTFYYDHKAAAENGHCIVLSAKTVEQISVLVGSLTQRGYIETELQCAKSDLSESIKKVDGQILFTRLIIGDTLQRNQLC